MFSINGKSYPYTEPLEYTQSETIRWRVINPTFSEHPMHLHGAFYKVLSLGDSESDTLYSGGRAGIGGDTESSGRPHDDDGMEAGT
jgi:FtsP/CotA-like multicopper oxidase with cupredoxin domain